MATASSIAPHPLFGMPPLPTRRFSVAEYHQMIDTGIVGEDPPVELLEGWIVPKMPRKPPHDGTLDLLEGELAPRLPPGWFLRTQKANTTSDSEPEPDVAAVRGDRRTYLQRHPTPADIGLLIEVSETTLAQDRQVKGRIYARAGVPIYWVVNLVDGWIEVYSDPDSTAAVPTYRTRTDYRRGDSIPLLLDGQVLTTLPVADLLP
jgi:Uma2 family endonuclease